MLITGLAISSGVCGHRDRSETERHWIIGAQQDCYGQPDLIYELTASVILETEAGGSTRNTGLLTFSINLIISSHVQKSQNAQWEFLGHCQESMCRDRLGVNNQKGCCALHFLPVLLKDFALAEHAEL